MKCKICKNKMSWDKSYGKKDYMICLSCFKRLSKKINKTMCREGILLELVFEMGAIREEEKGK